MRVTRRRRVLVVGDSVIAGALHRLAELKQWRVVVDARPCRQVTRRVDGCGATDIPSGVDALTDGLRRLRPHAVVAHLGHNGQLKPAELDAFMSVAVAEGVGQVLWLTCAQPQVWRTDNNEVIRAGVRRWPRTQLVDWYALSAGQPWFRNDLVHLNPEGARAMARTLADALRQPLTD